MRKMLTFAFIMLTFLLSAIVTQPYTFAVDSQSEQSFYDDYIEPHYMIDCNFYDIELKASFNKSFDIAFTSLKPLKDPALSTKAPETYEVSEKVEHMFLKQSTSNFILRPTTVNLIENWYDGQITERAIDVSDFDEFFETGFQYIGWFPAPNQMGEYLAWLYGWEFNSVISASRDYICSNKESMVNAIYETEVPNMPANTSFDDPNGMTITQDTGILQNAPTHQINNIQLGFEIKELNPDNSSMSTQDFGVSWLIAAFVLGMVAGWCAYSIFDPTPCSQDQVRRARQEGAEWAVNATLEEIEDILKDLWYQGKIDNTTYTMLLGAQTGVYPTVMEKFHNTFDDLDVEGGDSWFQTIISVLEQVFIWGIVIAFLIIVVYLIRKTGILKRGKKDAGSGGSGGITIIKASSAHNALETIFSLGLSVGSL